MKLSYVRIRNFRSCQEVELDLDHLHALVGANNAGKSTILRALEFLFNPSTKTLNEESFWNKDISLEIRVEAKFSKLNRAETEALKSYLLENGNFFIARSAKMGAIGKDDEEYSDSDEDKIRIGQHYKKLIPESEWLQEANINSNNISEWWKVKDTIGIGGLKFCEGWIKKPSVGDWKERAQEFIAKNKAELPFKEAWIDNPKGYANVLKGTLPFFVFVPAVRDVTEESKGTKSSPFGKLLSAIVQ